MLSYFDAFIQIANQRINEELNNAPFSYFNPEASICSNQRNGRGKRNALFRDL